MVATGDEVVVLDRLTDFGSLARLEGVPHEFVQGDVADAVTATGAADGCAAIVNFAAETNLDASGLASGGFIVTDVFGAHVLLEFARVAGIRFVQVSSDDVLAPSGPAAASQLGGDLQVLAYAQTYGANVSIVRGPSAYGPFQHPSSMPAGAIVGALDAGAPAPETLRGRWIHADDHSAAVELVLRKGDPGEIYSLGDDDDAMSALGWGRRRTAVEALAETVEWYRMNRAWWEPIKERTTLPSPEEQYVRRSSA
jgi:dTDP-glucose 4,6-dehydratase